VSADSPEVLSVAELSRRLSEVRQGEMHLKALLPVDNPHNAILRTRDITRYIGCTHQALLLWFPEMTRLKMPHLVDRPVVKSQLLPEKWQRELSRFFKAWDAQNLIKARVGGEWQLIGRHTSLAPLGTPAGPKADARVITMRIDVKTLGLKIT
jgi:hypothetical protein